MTVRLRLLSAQAVVDAAVRIEQKIIETYLGPNLSLSEVRDYASRGELNLIGEFSEACRKDLAYRATTVRTGRVVSSQPLSS